MGFDQSASFLAEMEIIELESNSPFVSKPHGETTEALHTTQMVVEDNIESRSNLNECEDSWVIEIKRGSEPSLSTHDQQPECCIYRIHKTLRDINQAAYTPQMVSIGPLHHFNEALKPMENYKEKYLTEFCKRSGKNQTELENRIKDNETKIRHCYDENLTTFTSDSFVKMILLDSVFVIEFFLRFYEFYAKKYRIFRFDRIIHKPCLWHTIFRDLILLENQLPYFMLHDLYNFAIPVTTTGDYRSFSSLAYFCLCKFFSPKIEIEKNPKKHCSCNCFSCLFCFWVSGVAGFFQSQQGQPQEEPQPLEQYFRNFESDENKHFTDIVRRSRSYNQKKPKNNNGHVHTYSATKLHEAGVNFKASRRPWPLGVEFRMGMLTMPRFHLDDRTELLLRNLMALEQCHYPDEGFICSYISLLDDLVNTESDVDLLVEKGIIIHGLGNNEAVAKLLNNLCKEIVYDGGYYSVIAKELNEHYENSWYKTVAKLRHVYFGDLWRSTGTIAAIVLLVLTFIQAYKAF